jgi:predicted DNA-binding transcriptional regulator AlpA
MEYEFELKLNLPTADIDTEELVERLGEAGCDDALIGLGQPGRLALKFTRQADSAKLAVISALRDVKEAVPAAKLIEVGPDFVGLTDVAEMLGMSRQNMRKLMLAHSRSFPPPVHEGSASIWHLEPVLHWLRARGDYNITQEQIDVAHIAMQINLAKAAARLEVPIQQEIRALVA